MLLLIDGISAHRLPVFSFSFRFDWTSSRQISYYPPKAFGGCTQSFATKPENRRVLGFLSLLLLCFRSALILRYLTSFSCCYSRSSMSWLRFSHELRKEKRKKKRKEKKDSDGFKIAKILLCGLLKTAFQYFIGLCLR